MQDCPVAQPLFGRVRGRVHHVAGLRGGQGGGFAAADTGLSGVGTFDPGHGVCGAELFVGQKPVKARQRPTAGWRYWPRRARAP